MYKNLQSFPEIRPVQIKVLTSHKLQDHVNEEQNPFVLKEDNPSQTNCQNQFSYPSLSCIEQERQKSLIHEKIHIVQNLKTLNLCKA